DRERQQAQAILNGFKQALGEKAAAFGWEIDPVQDLARVLRPPGTWNRKEPGQPVLVKVINGDTNGEGSRYSPEEFAGYAILVNGPKRKKRGESPNAARIQEGFRNTTLTSLAGTMRQRGMTKDAIAAALLAENKARCDPPLEKAEVRKIAESVARYE